MISLEEKIGIWKGMPQDTPEQQLWADNYYDEELMPLALKRFAQRYGRRPLPEYYGMILLLGADWSEVAFQVGLLSPQNIHVICTKDHMTQYRQLVNALQLEEESCLCTTITPGDMASLYRVMKKQHDIWDSVGKSAVDITGGTSESSVAAAMAAAVFGMDVYQLEMLYAPDVVRHEPGTEHMLQIPLPESVLGD